MNVLFICSRNQWRSPTAEKVFARHAGLRTRSRGLARSARRRLQSADLEWSDVVFVMEDAHHDRLLEHFAEHLGNRSVHVLDIPDEFRFMDPELVQILEAAVPPLLPPSA